MKNKEFNLSEKRNKLYTSETIFDYTYYEKDVKEFIKRLKEKINKDFDECSGSPCQEHKEITLKNLDKLAGEKLI